MDIDKLEQAQKRSIELEAISHEVICLVYPFLCCISIPSSHSNLQSDLQEVQDKEYYRQYIFTIFLQTSLSQSQKPGLDDIKCMQHAFYCDGSLKKLKQSHPQQPVLSPFPIVLPLASLLQMQRCFQKRKFSHSHFFKSGRKKIEQQWRKDPLPSKMVREMT